MYSVSALGKIDVLLFSLLILAGILIHLLKNFKTSSFSTRIYTLITSGLFLTILLELPTWLANEGNLNRQDFFYLMNVLSHSLSSLPTVAWMAYFDYRIYMDKKGVIRRTPLYLIMTLLILGVVVFNHFNRGFVFALSDTNTLERGFGSVLIPLIVYAEILVVLGFYLRRRKMISGRLAQTLLLYLLLPVIGSVIQMRISDTSINWPFYTLAVLLNYNLLEKHEMNKDELTRIPTRAQLLNRLKYKVNSGESFTLMLADLNHFKTINDNFGHLEGDKVLKTVASLLTSLTNTEDTVSRYGGDEFVLLIESEKEDIGSLIGNRVEKRLNEINRQNSAYAISLSFGYKFVRSPKGINTDELFSEVDKNMYEDKLKRKLSGDNLAAPVV
ncbi:MAG: GGDEF domain-containing protein [Spirochaetales bacterium]|nr:GGDEF domain-containing protein [Spirochaetales bacterium]